MLTIFIHTILENRTLYFVKKVLWWNHTKYLYRDDKYLEFFLVPRAVLKIFFKMFFIQIINFFLLPKKTILYTIKNNEFLSKRILYQQDWYHNIYYYKIIVCTDINDKIFRADVSISCTDFDKVTSPPLIALVSSSQVLF